MDLAEFVEWAASYRPPAAPVPDFDGATYDPARDHPRLAPMLQRVYAIMSDREWHTLRELAQRTGGSEAAVSARVRDLRKPKFGGHTVDLRYVQNGLWEYRLEPDGR